MATPVSHNRCPRSHTTDERPMCMDLLKTQELGKYSPGGLATGRFGVQIAP